MFHVKHCPEMGLILCPQGTPAAVDIAETRDPA